MPENNTHNFNTNSYNNISTVENNSTTLMNSNNINNSMSNRFNAFNNSAYTRMMNLEKKVLNLEKKLMASKKEYNSIKDRNEYVEKILKNYEKKYSGLFNFFEDCLELFFNDEELVNNQEIFVNIDSIKKCDFFNLNNSLEIKQNNFLQSTLGQAINNGVNIGLRYILPNWAEDKVIELKDNLLNYGLKEGISKTIQSTIDTGKSAIGIVTGNFENINQINEAVKNGGIIDNFSEIFDSVLNKVYSLGKINSTTYNLIRNGKNSILNNIEKNIESNLTNQINSSKNLENSINNWKKYFDKKDFSGMEKEYKKIKLELKVLVPLENTINNARAIENLHNLIKNNGQNFNLTQEEIELANKISRVKI